MMGVQYGVPEGWGSHHDKIEICKNAILLTDVWVGWLASHRVQSTS